MTDSHTAYLSFNLGECAPVDGDCVHSPHSVAWSPHNVLAVATHWALYLHINGLIASDAVLRPTYQPRGDTSSQMIITGLKWALGLGPEEAYPATCRLCVRTTRDLFVYRVLRYGKGRLRVSHGVCFIPKEAPIEELDDDDDTTGKEKRGRKRTSSSVRKTDDDNNSTTTTTALDARDAGKYVVGPGWCVMSYEWFPSDLLVVVTLGGIFLLNLDNDDSDETQLRVRLFPKLAFSFSGSPAASLLPSCAARVLGCDANDNRLVVASPYWIRVFSVSSMHVHMTHYVEIPSLCGIPAALCCMMSSTHNNNNNNNNAPPTMRVFVSAPMCLLEGSINMTVSNNPATSGALRADWTTTESWDVKSDLGDEIALRQFLVVPLDSFAPLEAMLTSNASSNTETTRTGSSSAKSSSSSSYIVLGVCRRRLVGFIGKRCMDLIRCVRMDGIVPPRDAAQEISGVAIHPSCTMAIVGIRFGIRGFPPFLLLPVGVNTPGGFLSRLLQLQEGFTSLFNKDAEASSSSAATSSSLLSSPARLENILHGLWNLEQATSYFVWENLLPKDPVAAMIAQIHYQEARRVSGTSGVKEEVKEEKNTHPIPSSSSSSSSFSSSYKVISALRRKYLEMRKEYGLELFLRFPEENAEWRLTILRILRRCPGDACIFELLLANAVRCMAEEVHYAGLTRKEKWTYAVVTEQTVQLAFLAAIQYARLYHQGSCEVAGKWIYDGEFAEKLGKFIEVIEKQQQKKKGGKNVVGPTSTSTSSLPLFPCSLCEKEEQTPFTMSLSSKVDTQQQIKGGTHDCSTGFHLTVFSGDTFIPLSFLKQDEVLSRCLECGIYDYVTGPCCRVCGGLMM